MRFTDGTARARLTLALDLVALASFVAIGMRSHAIGSIPGVFLRTAVPVVTAWLVTALFLSTYRPPSVPALVKTWLVAIPIGLVLRSLWVGSPTGGRFLVFLGVAMVFTLLFLVGARGVAALAGRRLAGRGTAQ